MKKNEDITFSQDKENTLPDYQRAVCGIVRISNHCYKLINHKGTIIWDSNSQKSITSALSQKSKDYYNNNKYLSEQRIWLIGTKKEHDTVWNYRNVASCCRRSLNREINEHIKQLIKKQETKKARRYFELWNNEVKKIAFFEILIDEYIKSLEESQEVQDSYLFSIIQPKEEPSNVSALKILYKNRSSFIEGKLAAENNMRFDNAKDNGGIWFPSGAGIDGDIYEYYYQKKFGDK